MPSLEEIRDAAEADLLTFIRLVAPHRMLGRCHEELVRWWERDEAKSHQMVLLPRDHQKSAMVAYRVAWAITRNPAITILYVSATTNLAEKQLKFIKDILTSKIYRRYWPDMVNADENKRERWTTSEFAVDHPKRKSEGVRDPTVFTAGLGSAITGLHCNVAVLDDVVVADNAYTKEGRDDVRSNYSFFASIETTDAREWVVGTRYHPGDLYSDLTDMVEEVYNEAGDVTSQAQVYEIFQREVEDAGDGSGEFLWPRQQRTDGKWFGFNREVLARKRAQYLDRTQFYAQYYNNPNDSGNEAISGELFQYYDRRLLEPRGDSWYLGETRLRTFAAMDFAYSIKNTADYTSIVVVGTDEQNRFYVLDIDRFKTNKVTEYFEHILKLHNKWRFNKIRCETTAAQSIIVEELRSNYIRQAGVPLSVDSFSPTRNQGSKEERIDATLRPRYEAQAVWHYKSSVIDELEQELKQVKPKHDDVKDALAMAISIAASPLHQVGSRRTQVRQQVMYHGRFGGVG